MSFLIKKFFEKTFFLSLLLIFLFYFFEPFFQVKSTQAAILSKEAEYVVEVGPIGGSATANYVFASFFNPSTSPKIVIIKRILIRAKASGAGTYANLTLRRITSAVGGTQILASQITKKNSKSENPILEIRHTGVTVTFAGTVNSRILSQAMPGGAGQWHSKREIVFGESDEKLILRKGEGIALYQEAAGTASQIIRIYIEWEEVEIEPLPQNEFLFSFPRVENAGGTNYVYHSFFNPSNSGKVIIVKRIWFGAETCDAAAVYTNNLVIRRISSASGGTQIPANDIPKKHTGSQNSVADIRHTGVTVTLVGQSNARIATVTPCGAAGQPHGFFYLNFNNNNEKIVLKPGEGIALIGETAGDVDQLTRLVLEWQEVDSLPSPQNEYIWASSRVEVAAAANTTFYTFFNPSNSSKTVLIKRLVIRNDADAAATYSAFTFRRLSSVSGGILIPATDIPKKHTDSSDPSLEIRWCGANCGTSILATYLGTTNSRILTVNGPGAVGQVIGHKEILFGENQNLILQPGEGIGFYIEAAGDVDHYIKVMIEWQEKSESISPKDEYLIDIGPIGGSTAANYVYSSFFNSGTVSKILKIKRIQIRVDTVGAAVYIPITLRRITSASGGTQILASEIPKKHLNSSNPVAEIRISNPSVTFFGTNNSKLISVQTPGAVGSALAPSLTGYKEIIFKNEEGIILKPGEGIALYQEAAGNANFRVKILIEWSEENLPPPKGEYLFSLGPIQGSLTSNYVYGALFNPSYSQKIYILKRMEIRADRTGAATAPSYIPVTIRKIYSLSGGTLISQDDITKKHSDTPTSSAEIRHTGPSVVFGDELRIVGVTVPGAVNQAYGDQEIEIVFGDEIILKPGEGIALYQEASAGDTNVVFRLAIVWEEREMAKILGKVFLDEGDNFSTEGSIVSLVVNGNFFSSTTASTIDGSFIFLFDEPPEDNSVILVFLDNSNEKGVTITRYNLSSWHILDLNIYLNRIIVRSENQNPISISDLDLFDFQQDSDILYLASSLNGTLETLENTEFFIWPGTTFNAWGEGIGNLSFSDLDIRGTFNATSNQQILVSCSGNFSGASCWQNLGNFNFASSTVIFNSNSSGKIINPGNNGFYNLEFNGFGGSWEFFSSVTINGNLRITQGTLTGNQDITIKGGNLDCGLTCGEINLTGGTIKIEGTGNFGTSGLSSNWTFYNLVFGTGNEQGSTQTFGQGTSTILNNLEIANSHTLNAGEKIWVLKNSGNPFKIFGNFICSSSTFSFEGDGTTTIPSTTFYNLKINPSLNTSSFVFSGSSTTSNDISILNGNVFAPEILVVGGSWENLGNFYHNNGKVIFNAFLPGKVINSGGTIAGKTFYNVEFNGIGGWQIQNDILAEGDFKIISAGFFDASTTQVTIEVRGDFKNFVGGTDTQWGDSILYLNKSSGGEIEINPKNVSDNYGTLRLGQNVKVLLWNSNAKILELEEGAGFYSRNHGGVNGLVYIQGNFEMKSGNEYWSFEKDFDGTPGANRQCIVQIASSSSFILNGASLEISGTSSHPTIITNNGNGTFSFNLLSGTFSANYYQFRNLDAKGLNIAGNVNVLSLDNGDFELAVEGGSLITLSPSVIEMGKRTFSSIRFATSSSAQSGYNVQLTSSPSCSQSYCYWRFTNHFGGLDGENYDLDPGDQSPGWIQWDDSQYYTPRSQNWRFYFDYDKETPQEPASQENSSPINIAKNTILKLRMTIKNIMDFPGENIKMRLQFSTSSDFSNAYFVKEIEECTTNDVFCYADGIDNDNDPITTLLLSDSEVKATHNESGISTSTYYHEAKKAGEWEFTIKAVNVEEGQVYYLRAFDNTFRQPVLTNEGYSYPSLVGGQSSLSFEIEGLPAGTSTEGVTTTIDTFPQAIYFPNLGLNNFQIGAQRFRISTNAPRGYQMFVFQGSELKNNQGEKILPFPCSNESPCPWDEWKNSTQSSAYGYHTGDDILFGGNSRFAPDDSYAALEDQPKEIAYHPFPVLNQVFDLIFRIEVTSLQPAGDYFGEVVYLLIPFF